MSRDHEGWTTLHRVAQNGNNELADALLAAGAEVDAVTPGGITPLCVAARAAINLEWGQRSDWDVGGVTWYGAGQRAVAKLLLAHGADVMKVNDEDARSYLLKGLTLG